MFDKLFIAVLLPFKIINSLLLVTMFVYKLERAQGILIRISPVLVI